MTTFNKLFKIGVLIFMLAITVNLTYLSYESSKMSEYEPELITNDEIHKMTVPGFEYEMKLEEKLFVYLSERLFETDPPALVRNTGKYLEVVRYDRSLLGRIMGSLRTRYNLRRERYNDRPYPECLNAVCFAVLPAEREINDYQRRQYIAYISNLKKLREQQKVDEDEGIDEFADKS